MGVELLKMDGRASAIHLKTQVLRLHDLLIFAFLSNHLKSGYFNKKHCVPSQLSLIILLSSLGIDMVENRGPQLNGVVGAFLGVAWLFVGLRLYVRGIMSKSFGLDDGFLVTAVVYHILLRSEIILTILR